MTENKTSKTRMMKKTHRGPYRPGRHGRYLEMTDWNKKRQAIWYAPIITLMCVAAGLFPSNAAAADVKARIKESWERRAKLISSIEFDFIEDLVWVDPKDEERVNTTERRRYIIAGDNIFKRCPEKQRAELLDKDGDLYQLNASDGKKSYVFHPKSDKPGGTNKDNLAIFPTAGLPNQQLAPQAIFNAIYDCFFIDEMLASEKLEISLEEGYVVLFDDMRPTLPFSAKMYLDPEKDYALVKTTLWRDDNIQAETVVESFHVQTLDGHTFYFPKKAWMKVNDIADPAFALAYTNYYSVDAVILNKEYPESAFTIEPRPGIRTLIWDEILKAGYIVGLPDQGENENSTATLPTRETTVTVASESSTQSAGSDSGPYAEESESSMTAIIIIFFIFGLAMVIFAFALILRRGKSR